MKLALMTCVCLFTLQLTSCGLNKNPTEIGENQEIKKGNIVNGKPVTKKDTLSKSVVAIILEKAEGQALCTGSLLDNNAILTAAHCVDDNPKDIKIIFGDNLKNTPKENILKGTHFYQHPNWNKHQEYGEADLAIIKFSGLIPEGYSPVELANKNLELTVGQKVIVIGFGVTDGIAKTDSGILRKTTTEILDQRSETEIVVDGQKSSVCFGDSGGPSFVKIKNKYLQWGIASSVSNQTCNEVAIHTEVMSYLDWIKTNSKEKLQKNKKS